MLQALRWGGWLTAERARGYCILLLLGYGVAVAALVGTGSGPLDFAGRPIGTDFSQVWAAGVSVWRGAPDAPFDIARQAELLREIFGPATPIYGWHYPPFFLVVAALLALLPYLPALLVWQLGTFLPYLAVLRTIRPGRLTLLAGAAYPAVFINLGHGHNGFLTALLLGGGLIWLERRPMLAGVLIGLLAYKPQFGLVLPLVLLLGRHWAATAAAAAVVLAMALASLAAFGTGTWRAFLDNLDFTRDVVLEQGSTGWEKIQSIFSAVRMWGGGIGLAYAVQATLTLAVLLATVWLWRSRADARLRLAFVPVASVLVTPYALDYDLMVLGLSLAFLTTHGEARGFRPWEVSLLALVWVVPIITRGVAAATGIPLGLLAMLGLAGWVLFRAASAQQPHQP